MIERIGASQSKKSKMEILAKHRGDEQLKSVIEAAYNPLKTYGIAKRPSADLSAQGDSFDQRTWDLLKGLETRELSGGSGREALSAEMVRLDAESAELLWRIVSKDLRAGFSESTISKVFPGLLPEYPYMRCSLPKNSNLSEFEFEEGVYSQKKANGLFASLSLFSTGDVSLVSRSGGEFPIDAFADIVAFARQRLIRGNQYHGELLVVENGKILARETGNGILTSVLKGGELAPGQMALYEVWDRVPLTAIKSKGKHEEPYRKRMESLERMLEPTGPQDNSEAPIRMICTRTVFSLKEAYEHCKELVHQGEEGTIIKRHSLIWKDGTSKDAVKLKIEAPCDLKVVGILSGREGKRTAGHAASLTCESSCGKLRVDVTVKNEAMREAIDKSPKDWIGRVVTVVFNEVMRPSQNNPFYSLFLPRFEDASYRVDKSEADDLDRVLEQFDEAKSTVGLIA